MYRSFVVEIKLEFKQAIFILSYLLQLFSLFAVTIYFVRRGGCLWYGLGDHVFHQDLIHVVSVQ